MIVLNKIALPIELQTDQFSKKTDLAIADKLRIFFDIVFATAFIILFLPVYVLIAVAVRVIKRPDKIQTGAHW